MKYEKQTFVNQVVDTSGNVITQGTTLRAEHLNNIEDGIDKVTNAFDNISQSQWAGKTAVFVGDSITASTASTVYYKLVSATLGLNSEGMGLNGSCVSKTSKKGDNSVAVPLSSRYQDIPNKDLIVIFMGTNDWNHETPLGDINDETDVSFYGAWNVVIPYLQGAYPSSRIVLVTPLHRYGYGNSYVTGEQRTYDYIPNDGGWTLGEYCEAIKKIGEKYSVPVIDLYSLSGLNPAIPVIRTKYMSDGLHPNSAASKIIANIICRYLNLYSADTLITPTITSDGVIDNTDGDGDSIVTNVTLSKSKANIMENDVLELIASISPISAKDKNVVWSIIEGSNYISIEPSGLTCNITATAIGSAKVRVTTNDGGYIATCSIEIIENTSVDVSGIAVKYGNAFVSSTDKNRLSSSINIYIDGNKKFSLKDPIKYEYALYRCTDETTQAGGVGSGWITSTQSYANQWIGVCIRNKDESNFDLTVDSNSLDDYVSIY